MPADVVSLLQHLVRIPSVNPDNNPGTELTGEMEIANFLAAWLEGLGAEAIVEEIRPGRPNLIARFAPLDGRPRILFGPHLDTVGVGGMIIDPFDGGVRDGKIWGRGASDTKGPMAAMLWALRETRELQATLPVAVDFVAFMGEESCQFGSKDFVKNHGHHYSFALVGEPTNLQTVHTTKGSLWTSLQATGKAAHSSQPERGENAILKLARALDVLDRHLVPKLKEFDHPVLGHSTLNVGTIEGGSRPNIVPDFATAEIDIRITPSLAAAGGALKLLTETITAFDLPIEIVDPVENPPMETSPDHPVIKSLLANGSGLTGAPWFSDAAHLAHGGIPGICIGPGSIDQAHTIDEFIKVSDLEAGAAFFEKFIRSL
ncbi:M20 family metallopeptidase [Luteolibacter pohnpeiensis]|uniref:M20 family metallopeptidase n=1 Tax=Luteolibacter pohnpeiensis TaxID=454153 RepID=A0A934S834_9BACT|nr:M20 family metallopeptidase [Luteolibacter pohnpeiensis]MBK1882959.1 M20 family metallopeptidase [Luteolibacter pohnpeiensis]